MKSKTCLAILATLVLMASVPASASIVVFALIPIEPTQVNQIPNGYVGEARLGLAVEARTNWSVFFRTLTVGAGWTFVCSSSGLPTNVERSLQDQDIGELMLLVTAPATIPKKYMVFGWTTIDEGSCADCQFAYRGRAVEDAASISISNTGVNFTLTVASEVNEADSWGFYVCKAAPCDEE